jgi:deoxyribodipyrimidine photolyase-related protein
MENGKPLGGKFSFDAANREPWSGAPAAPNNPTYPMDPVKEEVFALVASRFGDHPGRLEPDALPCTIEDAETTWKWARTRCLRTFGPYEDAMSESSRTLFHTRISSLLHLHRILPGRVVEETLPLDIPIESKEGFLRQILGWREFVRHVHRETDGFRDHGESPSHLGSRNPLPPAFWGDPSGLRCLDEVVRSVWEEGYSHHITRLMILSNIATLLDVSPRELTDWFWAAYTDAYDWVVEPNVLGMGTFAVGDLMTTKPYVSGTAYIDRMSDFCKTCAFDPKKNCPIARLYWAFLERHRDSLEGNPRLNMPLASLRKRSASKRRMDRETFEAVREALGRGEMLQPD